MLRTIHRWVQGKLGITDLQNNLTQTARDLIETNKDIVTLIELEKKQQVLIEDLERKLYIAESNYSGSCIENNRVLDELHKLTAVDVDTGCHRGTNTVIVTGVLRGKGYVQFYDMNEKEFQGVANQLRDMGKHQYIRNIDSPVFDFKGCFGLKEK